MVSYSYRYVVYLIGYVWQRDIVVDLDSLLVVHKQVHDVSHGGGHPASSLVEELVETLGTVGVGVTSS